ncbi:Transcriptional regulator, TetR family [Frankia sp. Hr75.2]|nr:Transcriptional regulator, TetR family [Frankia sp. Hr75.2]
MPQTSPDRRGRPRGTSARKYFDAKSQVLWNEFDNEVTTIRTNLQQTSGDLPVMDAVRHAVIAANYYRAEDVPELRMRMHLISTVPELVASATVHYDAWERAITEFVARRTDQPADSLYPLAVGRATLAVCRAAYERWSIHADADLTLYLDAALRALAAGFRDDILTAEPQGGGHGGDEPGARV